MKYRQFIESNFLIDDPKQGGKLVPFVFNPVQIAYYNDLIKQYDIENEEIGVPVREFIVKARREGFSSLILALFAADDILAETPTESMVISYRDDATAVFRKRYRRFILSWYAQKTGVTVEQIQEDPNVLEEFKKQVFSVDAADLELRLNRAHFFCGTAASRTGGRGGVLQKLLFTEPAHYQDTERMTAKEIVEGTSQQVDKSQGWIFQESTGNGKGNHFYKTYEQIKRGLSRYKLRFYGWREFYTEAQFKVIASEFTDPDMLKQEYPENEEEAFLSSSLAFASRRQILALVKNKASKHLAAHLELGGLNYVDQCEMIKDFALTHLKTHPNRNLYLGLDTAKDKDRTVLTILSDVEISANARIRGIAVDSTGQGDFVPDWLQRNTDWYISRVKFSRSTKSIMYKILQTVLQTKSTVLPQFLDGTEFVSSEWKNFFNQLLNLQKEIVGSLLVVAHPPGSCGEGEHDYENCIYHDDYPDSWALAEQLYITVNGMPAGQNPPEDGSNFDNAVRKLLNTGRKPTGSGEDYL